MYSWNQNIVQFDGRSLTMASDTTLNVQNRAVLSPYKKSWTAATRSWKVFRFFLLRRFRHRTREPVLDKKSPSSGHTRWSYSTFARNLTLVACCSAKCVYDMSPYTHARWSQGSVGANCCNDHSDSRTPEKKKQAFLKSKSFWKTNWAP